MEGCISTVQVTPPMEDNSAFAEHILWAPKKKRLHRRVMSANLPSGAIAHSHSKIRKRLIFPCPEESERKEKEEVSSNIPEAKKESNNEEKNSARTPDSSGDKRNESSLQLDLLKATNVRVEQFKTNQKGVRNVDPQRIKRKLALSSFRWRKKKHFTETKHWKILAFSRRIYNFNAVWDCDIESSWAMQFLQQLIYEKSVPRTCISICWFVFNLSCSKQLGKCRICDYLCELDLHIGRCNDFICRILYIYAVLLARMETDKPNSGQTKKSVVKPLKVIYKSRKLLRNEK